MPKFPNIDVISLNADTYKVYGAVPNTNGDMSVEYTVKASNVKEAYEKVFGFGSYEHEIHVDPHKDDPYLTFFRET